MERLAWMGEWIGARPTWLGHVFTNPICFGELRDEVEDQGGLPAPQEAGDDCHWRWSHGDMREFAVVSNWLGQPLWSEVGMQRQETSPAPAGRIFGTSPRQTSCWMLLSSQPLLAVSSSNLLN